MRPTTTTDTRVYCWSVAESMAGGYSPSNDPEPFTATLEDAITALHDAAHASLTAEEESREYEDCEDVDANLDDLPRMIANLRGTVHTPTGMTLYLPSVNNGNGWIITLTPDLTATECPGCENLNPLDTEHCPECNHYYGEHRTAYLSRFAGTPVCTCGAVYCED